MSIPALTSYPMPTQAATNRAAWTLEPRRAALLVHDMQHYFLNRYDRAAAPIPELLAHTERLLAACRAAGVPVFYTAQPVNQPAQDRALLNDFWGPGLTRPEHHGEQPIVEALAPQPHDTVLTKWRYSAFQRSDLQERLQAAGRDQLVICGIYAHIGCMATALEAFMRDIQPFFVLDAVADFSREEHDMAVRYVSQRCGMSVRLAEVLKALGQP